VRGGGSADRMARRRSDVPAEPELTGVLSWLASSIELDSHAAEIRMWSNGPITPLRTFGRFSVDKSEPDAAQAAGN
jgi:hypothetical protein